MVVVVVVYMMEKLYLIFFSCKIFLIVKSVSFLSLCAKGRLHAHCVWILRSKIKRNAELSDDNYTGY